MDWGICPLLRRFFSAMVRTDGVRSRTGPTLRMPPGGGGSTSCRGARCAAVNSSSAPAGRIAKDRKYLEIRPLEEGPKTAGQWGVLLPATDSRDKIILPEHPRDACGFCCVGALANNCPEILRRRRVSE